ncbi:hypothetical protein AGMMS49938_07510 [Fibrobacterales bacterium]|nr:hypothetical protein AGMMS49938_07510 [Fibrobacterales bacterium]
MLHDVVSAKIVGNYKIEMCFDDGHKGIVDFHRYLSLGGVFNYFSDLYFFENFKIDNDLGTLVWGDGLVDVAPETLYDLAYASP